MKFVCYTDWDQLPESADALFAQGEKENIFFSRPWFENLAAAALDDDHVMVLACVLAGDKVLAILPLMQRSGNAWHSLRHRYTTHYSMLLGAFDQQRTLDCLAQGLSRLPLQSLLLEPVAGDDGRMSGLQSSMETAGYSCDCSFRLYNWILRVQGQSFEGYMAARPARLRNTIARKKRKLERENGYVIRLFAGDEVPQAMSDYHAVYRASWKANEQYADFLDGIVSGFSRRGWSRLAVLYVKDRPVAAQLWFVAHGKASIFRLAYDEAWRRYSPGSILTGFLMEYVIDIDGVDEVDFLTGNDAYKQDWMSERRERFALGCVNKVKPAGRCELFVESLKSMLKRLQGNAD
ncbi:GNAT family N-acetyltransferase [Thiohalobacter thiocyanaticus]|uniref:GNAT family N-acetyltransferase n=1 Tax=Thiohalobacter thiocyanaticus TaxID=585455 RepID=A0A426QE38_9GAMM|nr:GNAT family N-acetyltransferase [Thiohalobacter thiocyanaticus]RRQ20001.1 GNAT family N-acetyltransferase [Thiohalobacter thiocyanaticus]